MRKNYNIYRKEYRVERSNVELDKWGQMYFEGNDIEYLKNQRYISGNFKFRDKPYKFYFFRLVGWFFLRLIKPYHPKRRLDTQSKRHITIVALMVVTIVLTILTIIIMIK